MTKRATMPKKPAKADAAELPLSQIFPNAANFRKHFDDAALGELAVTIKAHGILQPLLVRPSRAKGGYELVAGERRLRAAKIAGLKSVPVSIREMNDMEVLEVMVVENDQREDLSPLERAQAYKQLLEKGYAVEDLAAKLGRSISTIHGMVKLLALPPAGRRAVESGVLSAHAAQLVARIPAAAAREKACTDVLAGAEPLSVRQTRDLIRREYMIELKLAPFSINDKTLTDAGACNVCPKMAGNNRAEFPDARGDVCTDPLCYAGKCRVHAERIRGKRTPPTGEPAMPTARFAAARPPTPWAARRTGRQSRCRLSMPPWPRRSRAISTRCVRCTRVTPIAPSSKRSSRPMKQLWTARIRASASACTGRVFSKPSSNPGVLAMSRINEMHEMTPAPVDTGAMLGALTTQLEILTRQMQGFSQDEKNLQVSDVIARYLAAAPDDLCGRVRAEAAKRRCGSLAAWCAAKSGSTKPAPPI